MVSAQAPCELYVSQPLIAQNLLNQAILSPAAADTYDENRQSQSSTGEFKAQVFMPLGMNFETQGLRLR